MYHNLQARKFVLFLTFFLIFLVAPLFGELKVPVQNAWVMDTANVMNTSEKAQLEQYLENLDAQTDIQIAVYTVDSLSGYSVEEYSLAVVDFWKLGQKQSDKGVLLFVAMDERKIRIEVGYGLEGSLTDAKSGLIIRKVIAPYFQDGQFGSGIIAGVQTIANTVAGENAGYADTELTSVVAEDESAGPSSAFSAVVLLLFLILMLINISRRGAGSGKYTKNSTGRFVKDIIWIQVLSSILGSSGRGSSGGGFSSGSGFGSGGGFSGGGGGGFGGGGASGGW